MDPATALGTAAAAVQFIEVGLKTLALCKEIRDSDTDTTLLRAELQKATKQLETIQAGATGLVPARHLTIHQTMQPRLFSDCERIAESTLGDPGNRTEKAFRCSKGCTARNERPGEGREDSEQA